jgi:hypothetical protein
MTCLCWAFLLALGPCMMIAGITCVAVGSQDKGAMAAASPSTDFILLGAVCRVEEVAWRSIVHVRKRGQTCEEGYT